MVSAKSYEAFKADPKKIAGQRILLTTNSTVDYAVRNCLSHMKVDIKSVELVNLAQAPIVTAFISGKTELGGLWAPNIYSAQEKSDAKVLCSGQTVGVTIPGVLVARADYAKQNPKLVAAYLAVYVHSWQWAKKHPEEAAKMLQAADVEGGVPLSDFGVKEEFKRPTYSLAEQLDLMKSGSGGSKLESWMNSIGEFLVTSGTIPKAPETKSYITDDYMKLVDSDPKLKAFANSGD
jgi:NitT/TauT family transport system substrate-binding protein